MKYNPKPSSRAGIRQIICPKQNFETAVEELGKRKIDEIAPSYNALKISPRRKHKRERRERALRTHQNEVMKKWKRCSRSLRDESVTQLFESLLKNTKN